MEMCKYFQTYSILLFSQFLWYWGSVLISNVSQNDVIVFSKCNRITGCEWDPSSTLKHPLTPHILQGLVLSRVFRRTRLTKKKACLLITNSKSHLFSAHFISRVWRFLCDSYRIVVVSVVDTPAWMVTQVWGRKCQWETYDLWPWQIKNH